MAKYIVQMVNAHTGEVLETMDEEFDTLEAAENYAMESRNDFASGAEVLDDAGYSFTDPDDVDFVVEEV